MDMSVVEDLICDRKFAYIQPSYALPCELGRGNGRKYLKNAKNAPWVFIISYFQGGVMQLFLIIIFAITLQTVKRRLRL